MLGNNSYAQQINNLENREKSYYSAAGASTYVDFREKIKAVIDDDIAYGLSQLGGNNLRKNLEKLRDLHMDETLETQKEITVIIDTYGLEKANKGINKTLAKLNESFAGNKNASFTRQKGGKIRMSIKPDPRLLKEVLNFFDEVNEEGNKRRGRKYATDSAKVSSALLTRLSDLEEKGLFILSAEESETGKRLADTLQTSSKYLGYPWNFRKGDIDIAILQEDEALFKAKLTRALRDIREWLVGFANGNPMLRDSIIEEWEKIVGENERDLTNASFFLKGGYIELVVGAMGEF
jgi:hypothetical protein